MKLKVVFIVFFSLYLLNVGAKSVAEMFESMPDSLMPYVSNEQRVDLVNMKNIDPTTPAKLNTMLKADIVMDSLSEDRMKIIAGTVRYDMIRLQMNGRSDSIYCVLCTVSTPVKETTCTLYDDAWNVVGYIDLCDVVKRSFEGNVGDMQTFEKMEIPAVEALMENDNMTLSIELRDALPLKEENNDRNVVLQRKLKWNGKSFKEC